MGELKAEGKAAAQQAQAAAGAAAAAAFATSLASGGVNLASLWTLLNTFQLLVVVGMLEIKFPPKFEAFVHGFKLASLNLPD